MYSHGNEHHRLQETKKESSVLYKHAMEEPNEAPNEAEFKKALVGTFRNSLSWVIKESIRVKDRRTEQLFNFVGSV